MAHVQDYRKIEFEYLNGLGNRVLQNITDNKSYKI